MCNGWNERKGWQEKLEKRKAEEKREIGREKCIWLCHRMVGERKEERQEEARRLLSTIHTHTHTAIEICQFTKKCCSRNHSCVV
mmetsp:Transcript_40362/g.45485  ORF Transcript_40362/g.45485 Transcript_40362/m.45485 type:complete len:84 (+) Transcript_40362:444-695(+)